MWECPRCFLANEKVNETCQECGHDKPFGRHHDVGQSGSVTGCIWTSVEDGLPACRSVIVSYKFGVMEADCVCGKFVTPRLEKFTEVPGVTHWMHLPDKAKP